MVADSSWTRLLSWVISGMVPEGSMVTEPPIHSVLAGRVRETVAVLGMRSVGALRAGALAVARTLPVRSRKTTFEAGASTAPTLWTVTFM